MRSTRFMGKKMVGKPMRSPSGSLIWRMKWSKEFRSMQRNVIPDGLMDSSSPHTFSLGVCRLTTTIEWGSISYARTLFHYRIQELGSDGDELPKLWIRAARLRRMPSTAKTAWDRDSAQA